MMTLRFVTSWTRLSWFKLVPLGKSFYDRPRGTLILSEKDIFVIFAAKNTTSYNPLLFHFTAKPIRAGHHPGSSIPVGPVGIRGGGGPRPPVVKALTEADLLRSSYQN